MSLYTLEVTRYNSTVIDVAEEARSLPKNREAEQVVLGCAIVEAETVMPLLTEKLKPHHFYFRAHRTIFQTLVELFDQGQPIDLITLGNRLEEKGALPEVGGRAYLSELLSTVSTTTSAGYYADIVVKKALLRELTQVGQEIAELGFREEQEIDKLLDTAEEKVFQISRQTLQDSYQAVGEILHEHLDLLEKLQETGRSSVTGLATGFRDLDKRTAGFHPADLVVVAGRPSMGKSSFVLSIARNVALHENKSVGIFSLEMTKEQLIERLLCAEAGINLLRLRSGYLGADSEAWRKIMMAANHLQKAKILIDDTPAISVMELKTKARRMKAEYGLDLLIVDYLQLVEGGSKVEMREQEISYIARSLKSLARELGIPVIACSQLSRAVERRDSKRPRLSDLRECVTGDTQVIDAQTGDLLEVSQVRPGMSVIALGKGQQLQPARVLDVISKGVNRVYRLRTQTGREIRTTAAHPFLTDQGWHPLRNLTPGALIATTRSVSLAGERRDPELCRLLGYLTGDGTYLRHREIGFINSDPVLIQDIVEIAAKHFDVTVSRRPRFSSQQVAFVKKNANGYGRPHGNPLRNWLQELGLLGQRYDQKSVPTWVITADNRGIAQYLSGLFATDGSLVPRSRGYWDVKLSTTSLKLARQAQYLLARLGIVAGQTAGYQSSKATCPIYTVYLSRSEGNLERFAALIPLHGKKAELAQKLALGPRRQRTNSGLEVLPPIVSLMINQRRQQQALSHAALGYRGVGKRISRVRAQEVAQALGDPSISAWTESDLLWERVVSIVPEGEEPVWDLVVEDVHNFVANGIVVHNSGEIEQTADVVLFLFRKDYYDEEPKAEQEEDTSMGDEKSKTAVETEIIIGKQRNGPTDSFTLMFHKIYASFHDLHPFETVGEGRSPF